MGGNELLKQIRELIEGSGESRYAISQQTGISQSQVDTAAERATQGPAVCFRSSSGRSFSSLSFGDRRLGLLSRCLTSSSAPDSESD